MRVTIHPIALGFTRCFLLVGDGLVLIDCGMPNQAPAFERALAKLSVRPSDIGLIVLTHGHSDHAGSAKEIKQLTGAPLAVHERERAWLEQGQAPLPPGVTAWGRAFVRLLSHAGPALVPATTVDLPLTDDGLALADYGIAGRVVYTPGHTLGSVSVLAGERRGVGGRFGHERAALAPQPGAADSGREHAAGARDLAQAAGFGGHHHLSRPRQAVLGGGHAPGAGPGSAPGLKPRAKRPRVRGRGRPSPSLALGVRAV